MKRIAFLILIGIVSISLAGCVTAKKVVRERVDQEPSGNQGYLSGDAPVEYTDRATTREYIDIQIEVPTWQEFKKSLPKRAEGTEKGDAKRERTEDRAAAGNRGYMTSGGVEDEITYSREREPEPAVSRRPEPSVYEYEEDFIIDEPLFEEEALAPVYAEYTVKDGDTLSHIAKRFYGKAHKWTLIYEANSDKIKDPARIKPGTVIRIPDLGEIESQYIK